MTNPLSVVKPDVLKDNMMSIRSFLKHSYSSAKRNLQDGVNFFKDEFSTMYNTAGSYINQMMLPVNNYVKDPSEIEMGFQQAVTNDPAASNAGHLVPIEVAMRGPMEENY